jgi:hypothetical protein
MQINEILRLLMNFEKQYFSAMFTEKSRIPAIIELA